MGDLSVDTAVEPLGGGRYRAEVSRDWEIWGPMGGYVATVALRAVGAESALRRPASFFCQYLGVAAFEEIDIEVTCLRRGRSTESFRVVLSQGSRPILEGTVWTVADVDGLEHAETAPPAVRGPDELPSLAELTTERFPYPFWENFDVKPVEWSPDWPPPGPLEPTWRQWVRFVPEPTFADPWVDAGRALIVIDVQCWPSANRHHAWRWPEGEPEWIAPSLDLYVAFHQPRPEAEWLLADGHAPVAADGLVGWTGRLWTPEGTLVASGGGQMLCRRISGTTPA